MEEIIRQKCAEYEITPDFLTPHELEELREEIEAEQRGERILDSVLNNPEIHFRDMTRRVNPRHENPRIT